MLMFYVCYLYIDANRDATCGAETAYLSWVSDLTLGFSGVPVLVGGFSGVPVLVGFLF